MRFGVNTLLWTAAFDRSHGDLLRKVKDAGFDGIEIARFDFAGFPAGEIRRDCEGIGLQPVLCSALTGNASIITDDAAIRSRTLQFLKDGIRATAELGADTLVGPFLSAVGFLPGRRRTSDEWKRGIEGLQSLGDSLTSHRVTMAVEPLNRFETFALNTAQDAFDLCESVNHPNIGVLYDTFHGHIEEKDTATAIRTIGKHLKHVHTCENDRGVPGSGQVHWQAAFSALRDAGYDRWLVIESFGQTVPEIAAAACIWRDLAASPDHIMNGGLAFLKANV